MKRCRAIAAVAIVAVALLAGAAEAQQVEAVVTAYERELFYYQASGRHDPFRPLLAPGAEGTRLSDLSLRGVVHHADPARSVAILTTGESDQRIQGRVGERVGNVQIVAIQPDRVEVALEELGVVRRETLMLERARPTEADE